MPELPARRCRAPGSGAEWAAAIRSVVIGPNSGRPEPDHPEPDHPEPNPPEQPFLNDLVCTVSAPAFALSGTDGQIRPEGVQGGYVQDRRILSQLEVSVAGGRLAPVRRELVGDAGAVFLAAVRGLGSPGPDVTVTLERHREMHGSGMTETFRLQSYARQPVSTTLRLELAVDFADIGRVKAGGSGEASIALGAVAGRGWTGRGWTGPDGVRVAVGFVPPPGEPATGATTEAGPAWAVRLAPGESFDLRVEVAVQDPTPAVVAAPRTPVVGSIRVTSSDHRLDALVHRSVADLRALQLGDPTAPDDGYAAAGAPWYLTLFGRDALWAARLALPLSLDLAGGTLRVLARRQGVRYDPATAEEPGKIPHELRRAAVDHGGLVLPPLFYGTVDATPLWISLLHDAWRAGLPAAQVEALVPHLLRALEWLAAARSADGFLRYHDPTGHGMANQGWKDSADSIQFSDGSLATGSIALCEVQAYAYAAARDGAELLAAFDRPGAGRWRAYADRLAVDFRAAFWVTDAEGRYPAVALDGAGRPVDTVTSNLGHLLGTGLLRLEEEGLVVSRLAGPDLDCGLGLRTLSSRAVGFNPMSYHNGSIWTHDTGITIVGLARVGTPPAVELAGSLIKGLLTVSAATESRLPELHGCLGDRGLTPDAGEGHAAPQLLAYPASCRPQAWSAATAVAVLGVLIGWPDGRTGTDFRPLSPAPVARINVSGLSVTGRPVDVWMVEGRVQVRASSGTMPG